MGKWWSVGGRLAQGVPIIEVLCEPLKDHRSNARSPSGVSGYIGIRRRCEPEMSSPPVIDLATFFARQETGDASGRDGMGAIAVRCTNCGAGLSGAERFCPACGSGVTAPHPPSAGKAALVDRNSQTSFPIDDYDGLDASHIVGLVPKLSAHGAEVVAAHERATKGRTDVLAALYARLGSGTPVTPGAQHDVRAPRSTMSAASRSRAPLRAEGSAHEFPIAHYDTLDVAQILELIPTLTTHAAETVAARERNTKSRVEVLNALYARLAPPAPVRPARSVIEGRPTPSSYADLWPRAGGLLVDNLIQLAVLVPFGLMLGFTEGTLLYPLVALGSLVAWFGPSLWFAWMIGTTGQSPGMAMLGLKAVTDAGAPLGTGRGFGRWAAFTGFQVGGAALCCGLPFIGMVALLWMVWDQQNQTLHDKVAGSIIIKVASKPLSIDLFKVPGR